MSTWESRRRSDWPALHGLLVAALLTFAACVPAFHVWPLLWVVPLAGYAALVALARPLRKTFHPLRFGRATLPAVSATIALVLFSCAILLGFDARVRPDLSDYRAFLPAPPFGNVFLFGAVFSVLNACLEEVVFRGVLFDGVDSQWGGWVAIGITAFFFGSGHLRGYPPRPLGAILAGGYGFCLGWLRLSTGGIGLPIAAHIAADATIFFIIHRAGVV
jgi:uncharacterized protein